MKLYKFPFPDHQTRKQRYGMKPHTLSFPVYHVLRGESESKHHHKITFGQGELGVALEVSHREPLQKVLQKMSPLQRCRNQGEELAEGIRKKHVCVAVEAD